MLKTLDITNDNFENDLMVFPHLELKSAKAQRCASIAKRLLFIFFVILRTFAQFVISLFKGKQGAEGCLLAVALGVWWALHMFVFYRKSIQCHVRAILEFNEEFRQEHMMHHSLNLTRNCWLVFAVWEIMNIILQFSAELAS